jgi:hypothetical protein
MSMLELMAVSGGGRIRAGICRHSQLVHGVSLKVGAKHELTAPLELVLRYSSGRFPFSSRTTSI